MRKAASRCYVVWHFDLEWGNIQAGHAWVAAQTDAADADVDRLGMAYPDAGVYVLNLRQHSREWLRWLEIALAAARRLQDRAGEGVALGNLGIAYAALGETRRAIQFYEQQLAIVREIGDRRGEGNDLATWAMPTISWARSAAPSSSMNKPCSLIAR